MASTALTPTTNTTMDPQQQKSIQQQIINEVNNLMVMDYEIIQSKTNETVAVQYFCNRDCEPLYFPDRTLATLLQVNLSTLRGRFNRLTKKYSGIRVLISEKSKARLSNYHFISCHPTSSSSSSPSSQSSPLQSSSSRSSPPPPSPPLQPVVIAGNMGANYTCDESGASSLHGLVALNHIDLVNHALSEWIAINHERLGTSIRDIEINLNRAKLSYIRHNDIITLLPKKYQCPSPSSSPPTSPAHYSTGSNPSYHAGAGYPANNHHLRPVAPSFSLGNPNPNQFRSPPNNIPPLNPPTSSSPSSSNNNNPSFNLIQNSGLNYLMNCSAVESYRLGSSYDNNHGLSPCSSTSTQSPTTSPSEDEYIYKYNHQSTSSSTTPSTSIPNHKRIGNDYPHIHPSPSVNNNHTHNHHYHPYQQNHNHNHQTSHQHDYLYHVEQEHQRSLSTKKQKQHLSVFPPTLTTPSSSSSSTPTTPPNVGGGIGNGLLTPFGTLPPLNPSSSPTSSSPSSSSSFMNLQKIHLGSLDMISKMTTINPIIVDCSYENETVGTKKKIDLSHLSGFNSLFKLLESSFIATASSSSSSSSSPQQGESLDIYWSGITGNNGSSPNNRKKIDQQRDDLDWNDFLINVREIIVCKPQHAMAVQSLLS